MSDPLVSICCLTYNHEPYVRDCLEGFMMQQTNFPFEVLIHDDASTDHTADIIREYEKKYPDVIKPIYQTENQHSKGVRISMTFNFPRVRGKYVAMCEGDDYWIDPLKLQKQVDFLEEHPEYSLCSHNSYRLFCDSGKKILFSSRGDTDISTAELLNGTSFATASLMFRHAFMEDLPLFITGCPVGDLPIRICMSVHGRVHHMHDVMCVYRVNTPSSWTNRMKDASRRREHLRRCHNWYLGLREIIPEHRAEVEEAVRRVLFMQLIEEKNYKELSNHKWAWKKIRKLPPKQRLFALIGVSYYKFLYNPVHHAIRKIFSR